QTLMNHLVRINGSQTVSLFENRVFLGCQGVESLHQGVGVQHQVGDTDADAADFIFVGGADAAAGGPDFAGTQLVFLGAVQLDVEGEGNVGARADVQLAQGDIFVLELLD